MAITLNGLTVIGLRLFTPWKGPWIADVDLDPVSAALAPSSGPAVLVIDRATLKGTVDPRGTGSFVSSARVRVVAGGGGWDQPVSGQHFHNEAGVLSTTVYSATGAAVGEVVADLIPSILGIDFVRSAGPAARVFREADWWVDLLGITQVGPRPPAIPDLSLQVMTWDPTEHRAEVTCDALVLPGTPLTDARIGGVPVTVRDVEQTFSSKGGSRAMVWCSSHAVSRLSAALKNLVRETAKLSFARIYVYRVIVQSEVDGRLQLQAVDRKAGLPDTLPLSIWTGMSGITAKLQPSSEVLVEFLEGDPTRPIVRGFSTEGKPLVLTIDGLMVNIAGGGDFLVKALPYAGLLQALATFASAVGSATTPAQIIAAGGALAAALPALPPPATVKTRAS